MLCKVFVIQYIHLNSVWPHDWNYCRLWTNTVLPWNRSYLALSQNTFFQARLGEIPDLYYGNQHLIFHESSWTLFPYYSMGRFQYIYLSLERKHILQSSGRNSYIYQMEIPPFAFQVSFENSHRKKWDILLQNPNSKVLLQILQSEDKKRNWDIPLRIMVRMI